MTDLSKEGRARKIALDTSIYCGASIGTYGGDQDCDHDYPPEKSEDEAEYACWTCTKCGMRTCFEVWQ